MSVSLKLAYHKIEVVLFTSRKILETFVLDMEICAITSQPNIRYLGVMIKTSREVCYRKSARRAMTFMRLMPNIGGGKENSRVTEPLTMAKETGWVCESKVDVLPN